jgi:hypothetical protein
VFPRNPEQEAIRMRNFLAFLAAAIIVVGGVGWYLDWFKLSTKPNGDGHRKVELDVDTPKVSHDVTNAVEKSRDYIEKEKSAAPKPEEKGVEIKADSNGVELKGKHVDVNLPPLPSLPPNH